MSKDSIEIAFEEFNHCIPKPLQSIMRAFRSEFRASLRRLIQRLDLVTKDEFLVQKRLLEEAYREIERLKQENG